MSIVPLAICLKKNTLFFYLVFTSGRSNIKHYGIRIASKYKFNCN